MDRREKRRKFHQAIVDIFYPTPTRPHQPAEEDEDPAIVPSALLLNQIQDPESSDRPSSSSGDDGEDGQSRLTRAQRKKLRKKKLKESTTSSSPHRRKIIGPLLPEAVTNPDGEDRCQGVGENAAEIRTQNSPPEECNSRKEGKVKRRRMAKKEMRSKDGDSAKG